MRFTNLLPFALVALTVNGFVHPPSSSFCTSTNFCRLDLNALQQLTDNPAVSTLMSVYNKFQTVSGFSDFQNGIISEVTSYIATAKLPTATDAAAITTDPAYTKMYSDMNSIMTKYIATETYLPKSVKSSLAAELKSAQSVVATATNGGAAPSGTGVTAQQSGSAAKVMGMGAALAAGVVGVVML